MLLLDSAARPQSVTLAQNCKALIVTDNRAYLSMNAPLHDAQTSGAGDGVHGSNLHFGQVPPAGVFSPRRWRGGGSGVAGARRPASAAAVTSHANACHGAKRAGGDRPRGDALGRRPLRRAAAGTARRGGTAGAGDAAGAGFAGDGAVPAGGPVRALLAATGSLTQAQAAALRRALARRAAARAAAARCRDAGGRRGGSSTAALLAAAAVFAAAARTAAAAGGAAGPLCVGLEGATTR